MSIDLRDTEASVLVAGAGGFIGGWVVKRLLALGLTRVRAVDIKPTSEWFQLFPEVANLSLDLMDSANCDKATLDVDYVFNFAADMGGMGFIENHKALCMLSVLINTNLLRSSAKAGVSRFFFASSACVYRQDKQGDDFFGGLRESDAYPADPEDGYGWEKLFSERMARHFDEDFGIESRIARFHNVYGPEGTWTGGREKAPAALARKVAQAKLTGKHEIDIWGDGEQKRSFTFIEDAVEGTVQLFESDYNSPLNIGSEEMVSVNQMVDILEEIAGIRLKRKYILDAPQGVRGRNSDNTLIRSTLGWAPATPLVLGLETTYSWIENQVKNS